MHEHSVPSVAPKSVEETDSDGVFADLPLLSRTPETWAPLAAADLRAFLSDHAVCEQQAALSAMALIGQYPDDPELVERMSALAAEEISHMRRVLGILHRRGWRAAGRRANPWAQGLRAHLKGVPEPWLKADRLLVGALIEARSCERFTLLHAASGDAEVKALLLDLGPAEKRHWRLFHRLAARPFAAAEIETHFRRWLEIERDLAATGGVRPTVHG
jgi:tRNA-(ms[2]io[6]A)-hydroxylase